jgi:hypothetical protein
LRIVCEEYVLHIVCKEMFEYCLRRRRCLPIVCAEELHV